MILLLIGQYYTLPVVFLSFFFFNLVFHLIFSTSDQKFYVFLHGAHGETKIKIFRGKRDRSCLHRDGKIGGYLVIESYICVRQESNVIRKCFSFYIPIIYRRMYTVIFSKRQPVWNSYNSITVDFLLRQFTLLPKIHIHRLVPVSFTNGYSRIPQVYSGSFHFSLTRVTRVKGFIFG